MRDDFGRNINYMRISITDLCNLRCRYCMPEDVEKISMGDILTFEEIEFVVRTVAKRGIAHIRLTGGEPLVRKGCSSLVKIINEIPGIDDVGITTNGVLLSEMLPSLKEAGLSSVNISLDTLDRNIYKEITGFDKLDEVIKGMNMALDMGLKVKINAVLLEDKNSSYWRELVELAKDKKIHVRFIEMMPIGYGGEYTPISNQNILDSLKQEFDRVEDSHVEGNGPATYIKISGYKGKIGFISAIHNKFCGSCNRIRLTSTGKIKPCLCFGDLVDIRSIVRANLDNIEKEKMLLGAFEKALKIKPKEHRFDVKGAITEKHNMIEIGG